MSLELLGAQEVPRGILIRVRNPGQLAAKEGGAAGQVAAALVPQTIEGVVLTKIQEQLSSALKQQGVDADVTVVTAAGHQPAKSGFREGAAVGAGAVGIGYLAWRFGLSRIASRLFGGGT